MAVILAPGTSISRILRPFRKSQIVTLFVVDSAINLLSGLIVAYTFMFTPEAITVSISCDFALKDKNVDEYNAKNNFEIFIVEIMVYLWKND